MTDEIVLMQRLQSQSGDTTAALARAYSVWGEHATGWIGLGLVGAAFDARRRDQWLAVTTGSILAHGSAVVMKRLIRRPRPSDPRVQALVKTPSALSFPSAHMSSTTAAAVALAPLVGSGPAGALVLAMALSRVALGVHYPTDVVAGAAIGVACGWATRADVR